MSDDKEKHNENSENDNKSSRSKEEELFLTSGVHIGTQQKSRNMIDYIFKVRNDGLYVLDVKQSVERIKIAGKFLSRYDPEDILIVSARQYGQKPVEVMAKAIGAHYFAGRFVPGTLTNPSLSLYIEPKVILLTDPIPDAQAMKEAISVGMTIVSLCDANNETRFIDYVIPANNKGRRALATVYWELTKDYMLAKGEIKTDEDFPLRIEDFEAKI